MSDSKQSTVFGLGGVSVIGAIFFLAIRSTPIEVRPIPPVTATAVRDTFETTTTFDSIGSVTVSYERGRRLLAEYFGADWHSLERPDVSRRPVRLNVLIATLADPYDSYLDWSFDANVESLRRAFGIAGYVPQSYWLPNRKDSLTVTHGIGSGTYSAQDFYPGVFLFRSISTETPELALLYVVPELPSSGLRRRAFQAAILDRAAIMRSSRAVFTISDTVRTRLSILGPTFSGSSSSLRYLLDAATRDTGSTVCAAEIVSGSATSYGNLKVLTDSQAVGLHDGRCIRVRADSFPAGTSFPRLEFSATVNPDEAMDATLVNVIKRMKVADHQVAIFSESGTQYGAVDKNAGLLAKYLTVTFPMNIGSLRAEYARTPGVGTGASELPQLGAAPRTKIVLDENLRPREFPQMTSQLTVPTADVVLSAAMVSLREHGIKLVVLRATDVRDKLMLVRELRRNLRDVTIVLYENNVLLRHPEYAGTMRGSLVLSSYPMVLENQYWSQSWRSVKDSATRTLLRNLTSFPNDASIGVFNAALTLLGHRASRIEYGMPNAVTTAAAHPLIWLSVIGTDGFYPLRADTTDTAWQKYISASANSPAPIAADTLVHEHVYGVPDLALVATLIVPACFITALMGLMSLGSRIPRPFASVTGPGLERRRKPFWYFRVPMSLRKPGSLRQWAFLSLFGISVSATFLLLAVAAIGRRAIESFQSNSLRAGSTLTFVCILLGIAIVLPLAGAARTLPRAMRLGGERQRRRAAAKHNPLPSDRVHVEREAKALAAYREPTLFVGIGILFISIACIAFATGAVGYAGRLSSVLAGGGMQSTFTWYRLLHFTSGVSPVTPIVLLGTAFASWTWWELQQLRVADRGNELESAIARLACSDNSIMWKRSYRAIADARRGLSWVMIGPAIWPIVSCVVVGAWIVHESGSTSLEGIANLSILDWTFDLALWIGILSIVTASAWAIYRLMFAWNGLERFLDIVAGTPVASAFGRLPLDVARLTDIGFLGFRRDCSNDQEFLRTLWGRGLSDAKSAVVIQDTILARTASAEAVAVGSSGVVPGKSDTLKPPAVPTEESLILKETNDTIAKLLREAQEHDPASVSSVEIALKVVRAGWEAARTRPDPLKELPIEEPKIGFPNARALRTIEEYLAFEILLFAEMYLLNIRRLCFFLFASLLVLVVVSSQYPYEPHSVVSVATLLLLFGTVGAIVFVMIRMSRSSTLSRISHTEPGKVTWDSSFVLNLLTFCVLPILALASSEFPEVRALVSGWIDPIARAFGHGL